MGWDTVTCECATNVKQALESADLFGRLWGRYEEVWPAVTERVLGMDHGFSYLSLCAVLDKVIKPEWGGTR